MTKLSKVLAVLDDGPATTDEVAAETGIPQPVVLSHLGNAWRTGRIAKRPFEGTKLWTTPQHAEFWGAEFAPRRKVA